MDFIVYFGSALVICAILIPVAVTFCRRLDIYDRQNRRKIHHGRICRIGGLPIFIGFFIPFSIFIIPRLVEHYNVLLYIVGMLIMFGTGLFDDFFNIRARYKLLFQVLAALLVSLAGFHISSLNLFNIVTIDPGIFTHFITVAIILICVNAVNLIDGMDGLAAGIILIANIFILSMAILSGNTLIALMVVLMSGAIFGFYIFNYHRAKIFMGDSGAYFIGFMYATIPFMEIHAGQVFPPFFLIACLILSVPIVDIANVIFIRIKNHSGIFSADMNHIHHRLLKIGFSEKGVLYIIYSYTALLGIWSILFYFISASLYPFLLALMAVMIFFSMCLLFWAERDAIQTSYYTLVTRKKYHF